MTDGFGDLLDRLYGGRAGTDDADPLTREVNAFLWPIVSVAGLAFKGTGSGMFGMVGAERIPIAVIRNRVVTRSPLPRTMSQLRVSSR